MSTTDFTTLLITGGDARTYLQGQLTCDMNLLTSANPLLGAINSPQGRVQAVMHITERPDGIALQVVTPIAEQAMARLKKYILRAKVKIDIVNDGSPNTTLADQLRTGVPHVFPQTHESFVAQMLNLDALGAISFNKGCYTGQEIIARAHYRGAVKRRMFRFAARCSPPKPGTPIVTQANASSHVGEVVYSIEDRDGCELLAVVALASHEAELELAETSGVSLAKLDLPYSLQF